MKKSLFLLLTLLVTCFSGAWAATSVTLDQEYTVPFGYSPVYYSYTATADGTLTFTKVSGGGNRMWGTVENYEQMESFSLDKNNYTQHDFTVTSGTTYYFAFSGAAQTFKFTVAAPSHEHVWATEWSHDATYHWHACTVDGCTEVNDKAAHTFTDGADCVCGQACPTVTLTTDVAQTLAVNTKYVYTTTGAGKVTLYFENIQYSEFTVKVGSTTYTQGDLVSTGGIFDPKNLTFDVDAATDVVMWLSVRNQTAASVTPKFETSGPKPGADKDHAITIKSGVNSNLFVYGWDQNKWYKAELVKGTFNLTTTDNTFKGNLYKADGTTLVSEMSSNAYSFECSVPEAGTYYFVLGASYGASNVTMTNTPAATYQVKFSSVGANAAEGTYLYLTSDTEQETSFDSPYTAEEGTSLTLVAMPSAIYEGEKLVGYRNVVVTRDGNPVELTSKYTYVFTPTAATEFVATFSDPVKTYALTVAENDDMASYTMVYESGEEVEVTKVKANTDVYFRPVAVDGKQVNAVKVNGTEVEFKDGCATFQITEASTVTVEIGVIPATTYVVTFAQPEHAALKANVFTDSKLGDEVKTGEEVEAGTELVFTLTPEAHYGNPVFKAGDEEVMCTTGTAYQYLVEVNAATTYTATVTRVYDDLEAEYATDGVFESYCGDSRFCKGEATAKATRSDDMTSYTLEFPSVTVNVSDNNKSFNLGTLKVTGAKYNEESKKLVATDVTARTDNNYDFTGWVSYDVTTGEAYVNGTFKYYGSDESYEVKYTVTRAVKATVSYELDGKSIVEVRKDAEDFTPTTTTPEGYTGTVTYTSNNTAVLTVTSDGTIHVVAPGHATVTVVAQSCKGFKASDATNLHVTVLTDEVRSTEVGKYGTVCLPSPVTEFEGATVLELVGRTTDGLNFKEVESLEAGKPYLYVATEATQKFAYDADATAEAVEVKGFVGNLGAAEQQLVAGQYFLSTSDNQFHPAAKAEGEDWNTYVYIGVHKCFFTSLPEVEEGARGTVVLGVSGNQATGINAANLVNLDKDGKFLVNGKLVIVKSGKMYNSAGQMIK